LSCSDKKFCKKFCKEDEEVKTCRNECPDDSKKKLKKCKRKCWKRSTCKTDCKKEGGTYEQKCPTYVPPSPSSPPPSSPLEGVEARSVTETVTSAAAGHAGFTFELIGGGVASVAMLVFLLLASRCLIGITRPLLLTALARCQPDSRHQTNNHSLP